MNAEFIVAKKYATAYLAVAGTSFNDEELARIERLQKFLVDAREVLFFFNLSLIEPDVTHKVIHELCTGFTTEKLLERLLQLICKERRALLVPTILKYVAELYREQHKSMVFMVTSSQPLMNEDKKGIEKFLKSSTGKKIDAVYAVDSTLIAGIRAQSTTLLWEQSVKKQLLTVRQSLIEQGVQWN